MAQVDIRQDDLVRVTLTLKARDAAEPLVISEAYTVEALGLRPGAAKAAVAAPAFDSAKYVRLLGENPEAASRMLGEFHDKAADAVAGGQITPGEQLAEAVVAHIIRSKPRGQTIVADEKSATGYVLTTREINIQGPFVAEGMRVWRCTAVGTWGSGI